MSEHPGNPPDSVVILNVDDHSAARYAKSRVLLAAGYTVIEADRGDLALKMAAERKPTLALLDVKLPDMSGFDVCRQLKSDPATSSILVIQNSASFVGAEDRVRGLEGGADTYLTAPIEPAVLLATVGAMLRLARAENELRQKGEALQRLVDSERAARALAERADRLKDEFVATLSHELRNPLVAIAGWVSLLKGTHVDAETRAQGLDVIERGCRTQRKLIEDLLDMSRIMSGKLRLDVQEVDLGVIIEAVVSSSQIAADAKAITIERTGDPSPRPIYGDTARLQQIVWNLFSNAIKFTPRGGRIRIGVEGGESEVRLTVADSGMGIDGKFLPHVFERFRQADPSTTRRFGGLGIGLSIVKSLVELHGGTVAVDSDGEGKGATFTVILPVGASPKVAGTTHVPAAQVEARAHRSESAIESMALTGSRVLVVDDDPDAVDLIARIFTRAGAVVATATSAEEALQLLRASRPDVVVSDIGMPDQDGFNLVRRIRMMESPQDARLPVAALTAMARPEDAAQVSAAGFDVHIAKPFEPVELIEAVAALIHQQHQSTGQAIPRAAADEETLIQRSIDCGHTEPSENAPSSARSYRE